MAGGLAERLPRCCATRSRSTTAAPQDVGLTTSYDPRRADTGRALHGSRCAPATTSTAAHGRPTRSVTTWGAPDQPGAPNASAGNGQISASWGTPAANGRPIDHYDVEHNHGGNKNVGGNSTSWNATNGTSYQVRVRACNVVGCATVERLEPDGHTTGTPTAGQRHRQLLRQRPGPGRLRKLALRVRAGRGDGPATEHDLHRHLQLPVEPGLERHQHHHERCRSTRRRAGAATTARPSSSGRWSAATARTRCPSRRPDRSMRRRRCTTPLAPTPDCHPPTPRHDQGTPR